jgi:two-component system, NarL family, response regulator DesR
VNPERSLMDTRAVAALRELSLSEQDPLVAAICASRESTARRLAQALFAGGIKVDLMARKLAGLLAPLGGHPVDAIICAVSGSDAGVIEARALRKRSPHTQLVLVMGNVTLPRLRRILDLGAQAIVLDTQVSTALVPAVRAARSGLVCVPAELSTGMGRGPLTRRQQEVLRLAAEGRGNAEIAHALYLSESTVKAHLSAAFAKVGIRSRSEASALLLDPDSGQSLLAHG